jgi:hypothetical protein
MCPPRQYGRQQHTASLGRRAGLFPPASRGNVGPPTATRPSGGNSVLRGTRLLFYFYCYGVLCKVAL